MARALALVALLSDASAARISRRKVGAAQCGLKGLSSSNETGISIVNGQDADFGEWKWQVGLRSRDSGTPWCGGMLIDPQWVLTAAHCVDREAKINVIAGDYDIGTEGDAGEQVEWGTWYMHPDYNRRTMEWDIALIRLDQPFTMNGEVGTVCLPTQGSDVVGGESCWITGWGTLSSGGSTPRILQEAQVTTLSNADCKNTGYRVKEITPDMLCAAGTSPNGNTDACQGDSGGPLVCASGGSYTVFGATSWGYGCAADNYPGIWSRVHASLDWIESTMA